MLPPLAFRAAFLTATLLAPVVAAWWQAARPRPLPVRRRRKRWR